MNKPTKVFVIAVAAVVGLLTFLVSLSVILPGKPAGPTAAGQPRIDMVKLEADYKSEARLVVADFLKLTESDQAATIEQIRQTKDRLLAMKVPPALKALHLKLVLAADKMIAFIQGQDTKGKIASLDIIKQAKADYDWLN